MKVSVIIPAYNCESFICECIDSICGARNRTKQAEIEVIVIDDGSTDNTREKCLSYSDKYDFIHYYYKDNGGSSSARNFGLTKATGEYVTFIDSDDYVNDEKYAAVLDYICNNPLDIVSFGMSYVSDKDLKEIVFRSSDLINEFIRYPVYMHSVCNKIVRKSLLDKYDIHFDEDLTVFEDLLFVFICYLHSDSHVHLDINAYRYRRGIESVTKKTRGEKIAKDGMVVSETIKKEAILFDKYYEFVNYFQYLDLANATVYLWEPSCFSPSKFRHLNKMNKKWDYPVRHMHKPIVFFANHYMDFLCAIYISLKKAYYRI